MRQLGEIRYPKYFNTLSSYLITKTRLYSFDTLKPHFYTLKLGFTGAYINFLILFKNIDCGYSLEPPHRGGSKSNHNQCFEQKFLISAQKYRLWVLVRTASPRRFSQVPIIYVLCRNMKTTRIFHLEVFIFWW